MIIKLPMPPSVNRYLMPSNNRLIKTSEARYYDQLIQIEKMKQHKFFSDANAIYKDRILKVDLHFVFLKERIIGKKGQIKANDVSNRIKIALDSLSKCIDIDDKMFKAHFVELLTCSKTNEECVYFILNPYKIRSIDEWKI